MKTIKLNSSPENEGSTLTVNDVTTLPVRTVIKVLWVIQASVGGVQYHRLEVPMYNLALHPDFECDRVMHIDTLSIDQIKDFQIVVFNSLLSFLPGDANILLITKLKSLGIKVICDVDDYWLLPPTHLHYRNFKQDKTSDYVINCIKNADLATCTTKYLQEEIKINFGIDAEILPNAIDPTQPQFEPDPQSSDKLRFGYIASIIHLRDIELLRKCFQNLHIDPDLTNRFELYLMGASEVDKLGGELPFMDAKYNSIARPSLIFKRMAEIMTAKGAYKENFEEIQRTNVYSYAMGYNYFDVALAPLETSLYNSCKSELKMIEAGFMKKGIIVSNRMPYSELARNNENCISITNGEYSGYAWYLAMKRLIDNPHLVEDMAEQLYEDVKVKYHIDTVTAKRVEIFKALANG